MRSPIRPSRPVPQPLKHTRYPLVLPKEKRMTIVAGFVNRSGVLLCADTLVGDSQQSSYRSKIIGSRFQDGEALFGYCGVLGFSESAIQRCADVLERYRGRPRKIPAIVDSIRKLWTSPTGKEAAC